MVSGSKMKCIAKCPKGHCDCWYDSQTEKLNGAGFMDLFKRPKKDYSNGTKATLKKYGDKKIVSLEVVRTPILKILDRIINIVSFGKFDKLKNKYNYDDLFHLQLLAKIDLGGHQKNIVIEKNEVINVSSSTSTKTTSQFTPVPLNSREITINELLTKTREAIGDTKFFLYDGLKNNCQDFILSILHTNNLSNSSIDTFVKQDITKVAEGLPDHVKKVMGITTELGARVSHAIGAGRQTSEYWKKNNDDFWNKQNNIRGDLLKDQEKQNEGKVSELDQYKNKEIKRVQDEVKEYEKTHGNSGNFFKDFNYGVASAKKQYFDPVKKVVDKAAPVLNLTPMGKALTTTLDKVDKGANMYNRAVGSGMHPRTMHRMSELL